MSETINTQTQSAISRDITLDKKLSVSVAMATYNGAKYIREQLDSIAAQTLLPDELIISDDGSTDATIEIAKSFQSTAPFNVIILENTDRLGYTKNFLRAATACQYDIIFFCDQDDIWKQNKIEIMTASFDDPETLMAFHAAWLVDGQAQPIGPLFRVGINNPWAVPLGMLTAFRKSLLVRNDLLDKSIDRYLPSRAFAHDQWIPLLASCFGRIQSVDEVLIHYRQHGGNVYGAVLAKHSVFENIMGKFYDRSRAFVVLKEKADRLTDIFIEFSKDHSLTEAWRQKASLAASAYSELSTRYKYRSEAYNAQNFIDRFKALTELLRMNAYSSTSLWTFGRKGLLRDFLFGVFFSNVIIKLKLKQLSGDGDCKKLW